MLDGQGCLLPVLRCHRQQLLLEEDKAVSLMVPWIFPKFCGTVNMVTHHLPELTSSGSAPSASTSTLDSKPDCKPRRGRRSKHGRNGDVLFASCPTGYGFGDNSSVQMTLQSVADNDAVVSSMTAEDGGAKSPSSSDGGPEIQPRRKRLRHTCKQQLVKEPRLIPGSFSRVRVCCCCFKRSHSGRCRKDSDMLLEAGEHADKIMTKAFEEESIAIQLQDADEEKLFKRGDVTMAKADEGESVTVQHKSSSDAIDLQDISIATSFYHMVEQETEAVNAGSGAEIQEDETSFIPGLNYDLSCRCLAFLSLADRDNLAMVAKRYRRLVRSSQLFDVRRNCGFVERWICIYACGDGKWMAFDPNQNKWRTLPPANVNPIFDLSDRESLSAGTHLLWLGREVFDFACYKYDLITNSWEKGPAMVNSRCLFASASCGDVAFVAGGFSVGGGPRPTILNSAEKYDSRVGKWEPLPAMQTPRQKCSGVFMDGKFFVIGGKDENHDALTSAEVYDPISKMWKTIPDMYLPQENAGTYEPSPPLLAVANNQLYAIDSSTNLLKGYNKSTNTWKVLGPVPVRADFCNGWGLAFKALGDELFVIGGYQASPSPGVAVFSWRPPLDSASPEWSPDVPPPEWKLVDFQLRTNGSFLYNCAVMVC